MFQHLGREHQIERVVGDGSGAIGFDQDLRKPGCPARSAPTYSQPVRQHAHVGSIGAAEIERALPWH